MRELDYLPMDEEKLRNQPADEAVRDLLTKYRQPRHWTFRFSYLSPEDTWKDLLKMYGKRRKDVR